MPEHRDQGEDNLASLWIVSAHAAEPQAILLCAVIDWQLVFLDKLLALAGGETHGVAVSLQVEEQLGPVLVLPLACVHGAAPQADDDGDVLNSDRALLF